MLTNLTCVSSVLISPSVSVGRVIALVLTGGVPGDCMLVDSGLDGECACRGGLTAVIEFGVLGIRSEASVKFSGLNVWFNDIDCVPGCPTVRCLGPTDLVTPVLGCEAMAAGCAEGCVLCSSGGPVHEALRTEVEVTYSRLKCAFPDLCRADFRYCGLRYGLGRRGLCYLLRRRR